MHRAHLSLRTFKLVLNFFHFLLRSLLPPGKRSVAWRVHVSRLTHSDLNSHLCAFMLAVRAIHNINLQSQTFPHQHRWLCSCVSTSYVYLTIGMSVCVQGSFACSPVRHILAVLDLSYTLVGCGPLHIIFIYCGTLMVPVVTRAMNDLSCTLVG